jgi:hypothetical protein
MINKILERLIANDFAELEGLQITGTIPVKQELLNEVIGGILAEGLPTPAPTAATTGGGSAARGSGATANPLRGLDLNALLKRVTRAQVTAHEGEIRLEFEIRR